MEQATDLESWKRLLDSIESNNDTVEVKVMTNLSHLFKHLSPQTAPRLRGELEKCTLRSEQLLGNLFDRVELSDNDVLLTFLDLLLSYGYFRIAQVTYYIDRQHDSLDLDTTYTPVVETSKWYELRPLLPGAGTIGWKGIMNHSLVREQPQLFRICLKLLMQKLHFYSIIMSLERYQESLDVVHRAGRKVAEKLFELIRDVAHDDECMIGLDTFLFTLLEPFTDEAQQSAIVHAAVQDLFKPFILQKYVGDEDIAKLNGLISECFMNNRHLQSLTIDTLLNHLKDNVVRRKRRHSVEVSCEGSVITLERLLSEAQSGTKLQELLPKANHLEVNAKSLQTSYISHWIIVMNRIITQQILIGSNSLKLLSVCSVLIAVAVSIEDSDLIQDLTFLVAKILDNTSSMVKIYQSWTPMLLLEITKLICYSEQSISTFDVSLQQVYISYFRRFLRICLFKHSKLAEDLSRFVSSISDKSMNRKVTHWLLCICLHQISDCLEQYKNRKGKTIDTFVDCARTCSERLYKCIKRNSGLRLKPPEGEENDSEQTTGNGSSDESSSAGVKRDVVIGTLVCILRIALRQKDQEVLDCYGDLIIKIFSCVLYRLEKLKEIINKGFQGVPDPIDIHLSKLLILYIEHKDALRAYLNYDLIEKIADLLIGSELRQMNGFTDDGVKVTKKLAYRQIKRSLESLSDRASKSADVYPAIINKQYGSVIEQSIGSAAEIRREKTCCHSYINQMKTFFELVSISLRHHDSEFYMKVLSDTVYNLQSCDPLDHPRVLYHFLMLNALIPKRHIPSNDESSTFQAPKQILDRISYSLIRISKSVELGPSIHAFTNSGIHKSSKGAQCCTYVNCIKIYTLVFLNYPPSVSDTLITDAMQMCVSSNLVQYAKYSTRLHKFFMMLASAIRELLQSICIGKKEEIILNSSMPIFLSVFTNLIRCVILASDRRKLDSLSEARTNSHVDDNGEKNLAKDPAEVLEDYENKLKLLAIDIGRTMNNLSHLRVKLVDFAPHLISAYIKDIQKASCPDSVRLYLNEGIFRIFNLVDAHQRERQEGIIEAGIQRKTTAGKASGSLFEMIHARLDQASREIFRDMHDNYNRFHRYLGKC